MSGSDSLTCHLRPMLINIKQIYPLRHTPNNLTHLTSGKYHGHGPDKLKWVKMKAMEALAVLGGKPNFLLFFSNKCFRELQAEKSAGGRICSC